MVQGGSIDGASFQKAYNEFRLARMARLQQAMDIRSLDCLACGDSPHAVHIDGNHKLFVWDRKQGQGLSQPTTRGELFYADEDVQRVVEFVDIATGSSGQVCSMWPVANSVQFKWHAKGLHLAALTLSSL